MSLEYLIEETKKSRSKNKYENLVKNLEIHVKCQKQEQIMEVINSVINIDVNELIYRVGVWENQLGHVRNNEEYDYVEKRIKVAKSILNAL